MRYKGKYVAQVTINFDVDVNKRMRPFDEIKRSFEHELTPELERIIREDFFLDGISSVEVVQMQAELHDAAEVGED